MGFVWAVRRSLRLLTLLTLMASALCTGQSLAAQEIASPRAILADSVSTPDSPGSMALVAMDLFEGESAVTLASAISPAATTAFGPDFAFAAALPAVPAVPAPLPRHFSPPAERAPPAA